MRWDAKGTTTLASAVCVVPVRASSFADATSFRFFFMSCSKAAIAAAFLDLWEG
uniref:Uncharacterized protein n=1 Tax=Sphingomonas sp. NS2 TaxID=908605 RepID=A0A0D4ZZC9_9SPHN|nr:hypothetical protein plasmid201_115 [Sphingomonas sp. NS2]